MKSKFYRDDGRRVTMLLVAAVAALAASGAAVAGGYGHGRHGAKACSTTSAAARLACGNEVADGYWIAIGNCTNLSDRHEQRDCREEALADWRAARKECGEQFKAREEVCAEIGQAPYDPEVDPENFVNPLAVGGDVAPNSYLPLVPGTRYVYENEAAGESVVVEVTRDTLELEGVECIVVRDVVRDSESGDLIEDTDDYFAQDVQGNVWYFGEIARNYEDGVLVDLEGSWRAGVDGAKPGVVMFAAPQVGDAYRQEFFLGDAEDLARVTSLAGSAESPYASCSSTCLVTDEFTPIEPDVLENKFYLPGIGKILTLDPETGEQEVLVDIEVF